MFQTSWKYNNPSSIRYDEKLDVIQGNRYWTAQKHVSQKVCCCSKRWRPIQVIPKLYDIRLYIWRLCNFDLLDSVNFGKNKWFKTVLIDDELSFIPGILLKENYYVLEKIVKLTLSAWPKYFKDFKRTCLSTLVDIFLYLVVKDIIFWTSFKKFLFSIVPLVTCKQV